jgi:uncharacterized protein YbjT (DUF2867 family)
VTQTATLTAERVAVIGATGRLGQRIVRDLDAAGASVIAISRGATDRPAAVALDALDSSALAAALAGATAVINAGPAQLAPIIAATKPAGAALITVGSLRRLLPPGHDGRAEALAAEAAARAAGGLILHPAVLYGDGQDPMTQWVRHSRFVPAPLRRIQPIHLDDAAQCFVAALMRWPVPVHAIDLVGPQPITQWAAYRRLAPQRTLMGVPWIYLSAYAHLTPSLDPQRAAEIARQRYDQVSDPGPMRTLLGITPRRFQP